MKKARTFAAKTIMELFDVGPGVALAVLVLSLAALVLATAYFIRSAPPREITISTGPEGSGSQRQAAAYAKILERDGVRVKIVPSLGSAENLKRLLDPKSGVDVGFVQGGVVKEGVENLVSASAMLKRLACWGDIRIRDSNHPVLPCTKAKSITNESWLLATCARFENRPLATSSSALITSASCSLGRPGLSMSTLY